MGYNRKGYSFNKALRTFKKTGYFKSKGNSSKGSGHEAGYKWGDKKNIDPDSRQRRYSKNSPSFDEGVHLSKNARKKALEKIQ